MFSLDRERYNLQNRCVYIYIGTHRSQGRTILPEEGAQRTAPCCEGVYILYIRIDTYIRIRLYISISYIYIIYTRARTHTHAHIYTLILPHRRGLYIRCVCARAQVCVCVYRQLGEGNSWEISKLTPF